MLAGLGAVIVIGIIVGAVFRSNREKNLMHRDLPDDWLMILKRNVALYRYLPDDIHIIVFDCFQGDIFGTAFFGDCVCCFDVSWSRQRRIDGSLCNRWQVAITANRDTSARSEVAGGNDIGNLFPCVQAGSVIFRYHSATYCISQRK